MTGWHGLPDIPADKPVLIAGPTASGKSALALRIAQEHGGVIINADASQVYECWRVITARPSMAEEAQASHALYGHVAWDAPYSAGHWLRDVTPLLTGPERPIIIGGTGLYFQALTRGMANIPLTPPDIRAQADQLSLSALLDGVDHTTRASLDIANRARVQRAWEVQATTGRGLAQWQAETPPPLVDIQTTTALVFDVSADWLLNRITRRFDIMLEQGALDEVAAMQDRYDPALPSCRAIGVPELMRHIIGNQTLDQAREQVGISTRQFAKRQRTWFRSKMKEWHQVRPET